ncbi:KAP P-loop containing protein, putative [Babesia ovata]|uniref:KAP P-loop containing protein, putative n=1 Tax=Babesia ovata TaxID=189622 RepID=A0A2H6KII9_9APIC|nr:KAP P-loop containing protein, putative [Babesia ovata]XP_028869057.1 KAP P-loop containing protein, putative [Babesia ovata]GBE62810.1 KAP P-loop containing protein, putative [Babesia ovata]GBE62814.1 KAP P-loop containing protein, putative [Babesia ovata]
MLDVFNVPVLYGFDVFGDLSEAFVCFTFNCPWLFTFFKAMLSQLSQLFGDLSVQRPSKPLKLRGDLVYATADFLRLSGQRSLLSVKGIFDAFEAFIISMLIFIPLVST